MGSLVRIEWEYLGKQRILYEILRSLKDFLQENMVQ